jgi:hypothetical protein
VLRGRYTQLPDPGGELSVGDYLRQWLAHMAGRVRPKTLDGYRGLIRLYACPGLGNLGLLELEPLEVQALYSQLLERGLSAGTRREPTPGPHPGARPSRALGSDHS